MSGVRQRWPAALALGASLLGLMFASLSSLDYIQHLDRQVHDVHCSFVPGLSAAAQADNACRVAMYSPFAALFRDRFWGGVPIALFAVGAFVFFLAFSLYLILAGRSAPRKALAFFAVFGTSPLLVSLVMAIISAVKLGEFCKTCVGIYVSSALLAFAAVSAWVAEPRGGAWAPSAARPWVSQTAPGAPPPASTGEPSVQPEGSYLLVAVCAFLLGICASLPGVIYISAIPSFTSYVTSCGKLEKPADSPNTLVHITPRGAKQPVTLFVDPLCPTCKALHQRLVSEGLFDKLDVTLVVFPLDSDCNWMVDRSLHPGSCAVSKAIICSDHRALSVLEWAYANQNDILDAAKLGAGVVNVRAMIKNRFPGLDACIDSKETTLRLNRTLRYIVNNHLPVSTPLMFVGETRLCDEDTDMGLAYTIRKLAPGLRDQ